MKSYCVDGGHDRGQPMRVWLGDTYVKWIHVNGESYVTHTVFTFYIFTRQCVNLEFSVYSL